MFNPKVKIDVLNLKPELYARLRSKGINSVGQLMDVPEGVGYEQRYGLAPDEAAKVREGIRKYLESCANRDNACFAADFKVGEEVLEYPSDEETETDRAYQAGYRAGWEAAVQVMKKSLDTIDKAIAQGMNM